MNNRTVLLNDIFGKSYQGHHYTDGPTCAEALREELLVPILRNAIDHNFTITIVCNRLVSASKSYLQETFGNLITYGHFTKIEINKHLNFKMKPSFLNDNFTKQVNNILDQAELLPKSKYVSTMKDGISSGRYIPNYLNSYYTKYLNSIRYQTKCGRGITPNSTAHLMDEVEFHNDGINREFREQLKKSFEETFSTQNPNPTLDKKLEQQYIRPNLFNKLYKVMGETSNDRSVINCLNNNFAINANDLSDDATRYILAIARTSSIDLHVKDNYLLRGDQSLDSHNKIEPKCVGFESDLNARLLRLEVVYYLNNKYILVFKTKLNGVIAYSFDRSEFGHKDLDTAMKSARCRQATFKVRLGSKYNFIFDYILGYYFIDLNQLELYGCVEYCNPTELEVILDKLPSIEDSKDEYELNSEIFTKMEPMHANEGTIEARGMDYDVVISDDASFSRGLTPFPSPICDEEHRYVQEDDVVSKERGLTSSVLPMDDSPFQVAPDKIRNSGTYGQHGGSEPQSYERDNSHSNDTSSSSSSDSGGGD